MTDTRPEAEYEALFARLQQIVERLEAGDLPLAEALDLYEQGVAAASACQQLLDSAALRVRSLADGAEQAPLDAETNR